MSAKDARPSSGLPITVTNEFNASKGELAMILSNVASAIERASLSLDKALENRLVKSAINMSRYCRPSREMPIRSTINSPTRQRAVPSTQLNRRRSATRTSSVQENSIKRLRASSLRKLLRTKTETLHESTGGNKAARAYQKHLYQTFKSIKFIRKLPSLQKNSIANRVLKLPRFPGYETKKTLIFDLDETLVHCVDEFAEYSDATLDIVFPNGETLKASINIRPHAREVLERASEMFEVVVFTASHKCYADAVLDYLDPTGTLIHHRLYRENCVVVQGVLMKDLRVLGDRELKDIVIVDNSVYSFGYQLDNGIPIIAWNDDYDDQELMNLLEYLQVLASCSDVREINRQAFNLRTFYEDYLNECAQYKKGKG